LKPSIPADQCGVMRQNTTWRVLPSSTAPARRGKLHPTDYCPLRSRKENVIIEEEAAKTGRR